ncbi:hypothetical protein IO90_19040 [Chryseobacterium sp. FH1]|nr:hypothetical protein IO90_19040 [Chryseobacterium sp. FH1]
MKKYLLVNRHQANKSLRFLNLLIDYSVIILFQFLIGTLIGILYYATQSRFMYKVILAVNDRLFSWLISIMILLSYYTLLEYYTKGRTIGKFITNTKAVDINGNDMTFNEVLVRSLCRIIPFEAFSFFGSIGWHDKISESRVVLIKSYEAELNVQSEINTLGTKS